MKVLSYMIWQGSCAAASLETLLTRRVYWNIKGKLPKRAIMARFRDACCHYIDLAVIVFVLHLPHVRCRIAFTSSLAMD